MTKDSNKELVAVRFTMDYRGKLTDEQFFVAGSVGEFRAGIAQALVDNDRAEYANSKKNGNGKDQVPPEPEPEPVPAN